MMSAMASPATPIPHPSVPTLGVPVLQRLPVHSWDRYDWFGNLRFLVFHVLAVAGAVLWPPGAREILLCLAVFYARLMGVTLGYHRYFAHRTFRTSRAFQLVLAFWAETSLQRGVLWWSGHHRNHHRFSDQPEDLHSPARMGLFWSHVGWILSSRYARTPFDAIPDMARFPELRWLDRHWIVPGVALAVALFAWGGLPALVWGFFVSTVVCWHCTYTINSLAHAWGRRRYPTTDTSRNNLLLALLTAGEGWHNNHHYYSPSARLGFRWWELDPGWYLLWVLEKLGVVWDVRRPTRRALEAEPVVDS
jgi:stearoyl-CoA desaturase (delta-9 desaturase)